VKVNQDGSSPPPRGAPPKTWMTRPRVVIDRAELDDEHPGCGLARGVELGD
jgi:hypothetical protein